MKTSISSEVVFIGCQAFCFISLVIFAQHVWLHTKCHRAPRLRVRGSELQSLLGNRSVLLSGLTQRPGWSDPILVPVILISVSPPEMLPEMSVLRKGTCEASGFYF